MDGAEAANYMNNLYKNAGPKLARKFKTDWSELSELTLPFHLNLSLKIQ